MSDGLETIDWAVICLYLLFALALGLWFSRRAGQSVESFFTGDRKLSWWIAGTSMVATTFAADTPLAVAGLVASGGIAGNWLWWSWAVAHVVATFFFARLWRRSGVLTDAEITELRYSGRTASALRGFKAVYFGIFINCMTMAWVIKAMAKISEAFFNIDNTIVIAGCIVFSVAYTILGGLRSVVVTDFVQFSLGMVGSLALGVLAVRSFGGIGALGDATTAGSGLLGELQATSLRFGHSENHVHDVLAFFPDSEHTLTPLAFLVVMLFVGWWRYAEGSGYIVQRLAACRSEADAQGASLWFAVAHNALRPWPWILVGLAALVVYPQIPGQSAERLTDPTGVVSVEPGVIDVAAGGRLNFRWPAQDLAAPATSATTPPLSATLLEQTVEVKLDTSAMDGGGSRFFATFAGFSTTSLAPLTLRSATGEYRIEGMRVELVDREMGYPLLMRTYLPAGLLGLVIASLLAAFMSTVDTHTNWGASYLTRDIYQRFIDPDAPAKRAVLVSRLAIVLIAVIAGLTSLGIDSIAGVWKFMITLGSGLGSVTAARWYWHRVTPQAEFAAILVTTVSTVGLAMAPPEFLMQLVGFLWGDQSPAGLAGMIQAAPILIVAAASLATWIPIALWGPQNDRHQLKAFYDKVLPPGPGWAAIAGHAGAADEHPLPWLALLSLTGIGVVFGALFGIGEMLLGSFTSGALSTGAAAVGGVWLARQGTRRRRRPPGTAETTTTGPSTQ